MSICSQSAHPVHLTPLDWSLSRSLASLLRRLRGCCRVARCSLCESLVHLELSALEADSTKQALHFDSQELELALLPKNRMLEHFERHGHFWPGDHHRRCALPSLGL